MLVGFSWDEGVCMLDCYGMNVCSLYYYGMEGCARGIIIGCGARVGLLDDVGLCLCDYCSLVFFELFRMK